uniref:Uncharacterized protein n=1 Tax=Heterorhabditis bacteriophora TaxID=37862 RepID=A0A1I7WUL7_HETBA
MLSDLPTWHRLERLHSSTLSSHIPNERSVRFRYFDFNDTPSSLHQNVSNRHYNKNIWTKTLSRTFWTKNYHGVTNIPLIKEHHNEKNIVIPYFSFFPYNRSLGFKRRNFDYPITHTRRSQRFWYREQNQQFTFTVNIPRLFSTKQRSLASLSAYAPPPPPQSAVLDQVNKPKSKRICRRGVKKDQRLKHLTDVELTVELNREQKAQVSATKFTTTKKVNNLKSLATDTSPIGQYVQPTVNFSNIFLISKLKDKYPSAISRILHEAARLGEAELKIEKKYGNYTFAFLFFLYLTFNVLLF